MVLVPTNAAKFPTVTVAWAVPDFHRTSFARFAKHVLSASFSSFMTKRYELKLALGT
jgi:hypothetical protein